MARFWRSITITIRFLLAVFCTSVLSPLPDAPGAATAAFLTLLSSIEGEPAVVIWKSQYSLTLYKGSLPVKTYRAVFGKGWADGDKEKEGDKRTPEGEFYICTKNHSKRFYKFMGLSYPSLKHANQGLKKGLITPQEYFEIERALVERQSPPWDTRLGGAVGIHGRILNEGVAQTARENWTDGCIALTNADIDELFSIVKLGTPVTIIP